MEAQLSNQQCIALDRVRHGTRPIICPHFALSKNVMRMNLKVPFAEKDQARKVGARWDAGRKVWYIEGHVDVAAFARWSPTPHDVQAPEVRMPKRGNANGVTASDTVHVGSRYVELPRVCDCLPWDDCDRCRLAVTSN
jgi:hypothetical protein